MKDKGFEDEYAMVFSEGFEKALRLKKIGEHVLEALHSLKGRYEENSPEHAYICGFERGIEERRELDRILEEKVLELKQLSNRRRGLQNSIER